MIATLFFLTQDWFQKFQYLRPQNLLRGLEPGLYSIPEIITEIETHKTTLIFHNTRAQAEIFFHNLWLANSKNLPIAIHHGSLDKEQRNQLKLRWFEGNYGLWFVREV